MSEFFKDLYNIPYLLTFFAYIFHEVLSLRIVLLLAHTGFFVLALIDRHMSGMIWNPLFITINTYHIIKILWLRRNIKFEPQIEEIYQLSFSNFSRKSFNEFWHQGETKDLEGTIIEDGQKPDYLGVIISGELTISKQNETLNTLGSARLFGEMSLLADRNATASVVAQSSSKVHVWSHQTLRTLKNDHNPIWDLLLAVLGKEMALKVSETNVKNTSKD